MCLYDPEELHDQCLKKSVECIIRVSNVLWAEMVENRGFCAPDLDRNTVYGNFTPFGY